jgi:hypothetical protein
LSGLKTSNDVTIDYSAYAGGFCVDVVNSTQPSIRRYYSTRTGEIANGICDGVLAVYAGTGTSGTADGTLTTAQFSSPRLVTGGTDGILYVAQSTSRIRKIDGNNVSTIVTAGFNGFGGMAVARDGTLYVSDMNNHRIKKVSPQGAVTNRRETLWVSLLTVTAISTGWIRVTIVFVKQPPLA